MNNDNFNIDMAAISENLNSNSVLRLCKQNMMSEFMEIKSSEPKSTQKQFCSQLRVSDRTIERYRDDIKMDSPYSRKKYRKKNNKSNSTITQTQTHKTNENTKNSKNTKSNKKNYLKGGDPNDIHMRGKDLSGQVFSNSSAENNQNQSTKFITLYKRMVDNVEDSHSLNG